jgi:DHA1 family bicyclomycin/chloramphenicol resistance-like MFS transporter
VYGLSPTQFSLVFALNATGMIVLGLLNARLVRRLPVRSLLLIGLALGGEGSAVPMAAVVAGGAVTALAATVLLTRGDHPEPEVDTDAAVSAQPIEE